MSNQILVPSLGESITEATVSKWLKQIGEQVNSDEPLVELETDKVNVEVPSPSDGTLSTIKVKEGDTVKVGSLLGIVEVEKSDLVKNAKIGTVDQPTYTPPKAVGKKNVVKAKTQERKKTISEKQKPLILADESKDKNSNGTLVLDTLAEENSKEIEV